MEKDASHHYKRTCTPPAGEQSGAHAITMPRMFRPLRLFDLTPVEKAGDSAAAYVPVVMAARALAFLRTLLVARILGDAGQIAFGLFQPAVELVNPLVALVLFGAADVTERYFSRIEHEHGRDAARLWSAKLARRTLLLGLFALLFILMFAPSLSRWVWGVGQVTLIMLCGFTVVCLALFQILVTTLRGARAFSAAAGMEILSATLFLLLSAAAATRRDANLLMAAYCLAVLIPFLIYGTRFWWPPAKPRRYGATAHPTSPLVPKSFAGWALLRLVLIMLFGFLSIWGVRHLADAGLSRRIAGFGARGLNLAADYAAPFRIAQLFAFLGITLWSAIFGIAARAWSQGRRQRARLQFSRVGRLGFAILFLLATAVVWGKTFFAMLLPTYADAIHAFLPGMTALFLWYAMAAYCASFADLAGKPARGAILWAVAVTTQVAAILYARSNLVGDSRTFDPRSYMLHLSLAGLGGALMIAGPWAMSGSTRPRAVGSSFPWERMLISAAVFLAPLALLLQPWVLPAVLALMLLSGQLVRPYDRRAIRRWLNRRPPPA